MKDGAVIPPPHPPPNPHHPADSLPPPPPSAPLLPGWLPPPQVYLHHPAKGKTTDITASAGIAIAIMSPGKGNATDANAGIAPPTPNPRSLLALKGRGASIANNTPMNNAPHDNTFLPSNRVISFR